MYKLTAGNKLIAGLCGAALTLTSAAPALAARSKTYFVVTPANQTQYTGMNVVLSKTVPFGKWRISALVGAGTNAPVALLNCYLNTGSTSANIDVGNLHLGSNAGQIMVGQVPLQGTLTVAKGQTATVIVACQPDITNAITVLAGSTLLVTSTSKIQP